MELPAGDAGPSLHQAAPGPGLGDWARYALRAARRHPLLVLLVFLAGAGGAVAYYRLRTPLYRVETRIMAQNQGFGALGRKVTPGDAPTRSVHDLVHRRENLVALLEHAGAKPVPEPAPEGLERLAALASEALATLAGGPAQAPEDPLDALVRRLDKALVVTAFDETVTFSVEWPHARQAYLLVDGALQNFLEDRHVQEITMADEAISLLQPRVAELREQVARVGDELRRTAADREVTRRAARVALPAPGEEPAEDLAWLKVSLDSKERAVADVEEIRRRRLTEAQAQLDAQRTILSDAHPTVAGLRQDVAALTRESPQITALREEARKVRAEYAARLAQAPRRVVRPQRPYEEPAPGQGPIEENERVREARFQYQQMVDRLAVAKLERDAAGAAFKYRYTVAWPAELPRSPSSPNPTRVFGVGLLGALLLAFGAATALELRRGLIVQRWQVLRQLRLPILAEQGPA